MQTIDEHNKTENDPSYQAKPRDLASSDTQQLLIELGNAVSIALLAFKQRAYPTSYFIDIEQVFNDLQVKLDKLRLISSIERKKITMEGLNEQLKTLSKELEDAGNTAISA